MVYFEYLNILIYLISLILIMSLLVFLNIILIDKNSYSEKITSYECGFQSFEYFINNFDIKYYIIAVIFLIFDLELIFFLPFLISSNFIFTCGLLSFFYFFILLVAGYFYEWKLNILRFNENINLNRYR